MIRLCIFDLDGTLLSTLSTINYYVSKTLVRYGLEAITDEECCRFIGNGAAKLIERAFAYRGVADSGTVASALKDYLSDYDSNPFHLTTIFPGIKELLWELKKLNTYTAVVSNKQDVSVKLACEHFFGNLVDLACGGQDGVPLKPDSRAVQPLLSHFGVSKDECAFIGDSDVDVQTGINLGCALNIAVTWGYRSRETLLAAGASNLADTADDVLKNINNFNEAI